MKKLTILFFINLVVFGYSQPIEDKTIIEFYPLKVVDTVYHQNQIDKIKEKHFFYQDDNTINPYLFLCSVERERVVFGEKNTCFSKDFGQENKQLLGFI
jgi:hypothetical protein